MPYAERRPQPKCPPASDRPSYHHLGDGVAAGWLPSPHLSAVLCPPEVSEPEDAAYLPRQRRTLTNSTLAQYVARTPQASQKAQRDDLHRVSCFAKHSGPASVCI